MSIHRKYEYEINKWQAVPLQNSIRDKIMNSRLSKPCSVRFVHDGVMTRMDIKARLGGEAIMLEGKSTNKTSTFLV
jgi:hypothetical protein